MRRREAQIDAAHGLYRDLVAQARWPTFYSQHGVPDSRDGRLELIYLHAILVMRRLRVEGATGQQLAQELFDLLFRDVDRHLREWGVGDLSVGKHVKALAQSFYGRATALDDPLASSDLPAIEAVLIRNVYAEVTDPTAIGAPWLAGYLLAQDRWLAAQDGSTLLAGSVSFAAPAN